MEKKCYRNIQRQLTSLIPIIELCMNLITEVDRTKNQLNILPVELESLKKQAIFLASQSPRKINLNFQTEVQEIEFKLDSLVDDLDRVLINLSTFDDKVKNVVALKEKLEAVQQERIDGITPERIYKLLEKQQRSPYQEDITFLDEDDHNSFLHNTPINIWQKITDFSHKFQHPRIAVSMAIIGSLSLGWLGGYFSSQNMQSIENSTLETTQELNNSSIDI